MRRVGGEISGAHPAIATDHGSFSFAAVRSASLMRKQTLLLLSAFVVTTFISFTASAQQYPIRLDRHEKAGQKYHLVATSTDNTTVDVKASDQLLKKDEDVVTVELSADVTILEVSSSDWATRRRQTSA
jgi:hypothetical protein